LSFAGNSVHAVGDVLLGLVEGGLAGVGSDFLLSLGAPIFSSRVSHVIEICFIVKALDFGLIMAKRGAVVGFLYGAQGADRPRSP
jgi:hypothetical protein